MCIGIALAWSSVPTELIGRHQLHRRKHDRGGEWEIQFFYHQRVAKLPIRRDGRLEFARWGNGRGQSRFLPRTGWTSQESIDQGTWRNVDAMIVDIPATLGNERGIWYTINEGIRGLLVADEGRKAVVYMICQPASHYYRIMTRSDHMPMLINQKI